MESFKGNQNMIMSMLNLILMSIINVVVWIVAPLLFALVFFVVLFTSAYIGLRELVTDTCDVIKDKIWRN